MNFPFVWFGLRITNEMSQHTPGKQIINTSEVNTFDISSSTPLGCAVLYIVCYGYTSIESSRYATDPLLPLPSPAWACLTRIRVTISSISSPIAPAHFSASYTRQRAQSSRHSGYKGILIWLLNYTILAQLTRTLRSMLHLIESVP